MKLPVRRTAAALAVVLTACLAATASSAVAGQRVTEIPLPAEFAGPNDIVAGPDGALWASDGSLGRVWQISTAGGKIRSYEVGQQASGITSAHGALWVADASGNKIVRVTTAGATTDFPLPEADSSPTDIVAGPDGALWFTETRGDAIGRLTPDGDLTEYDVPTAGAFASDIMVGPDGALWFSEQSGNKIGRITTAGAVTEYPLAADSLPGAIVAGPDGALYFAERNTNAIGRMTTAGELTDEFPIPAELANPLGLVLGPDGALWFTEHANGYITRMELDGTVTRRIRVPSGSPDALTTGPDGALWFVQGNLGQVARLDIGFDPPLTATGTTFEARADKPATHTVATFVDGESGTRPGDYCVTIKWGDHSTSSGTVRRLADGTFEVRGRHEYDKPGSYRVVVRIDDGDGRGHDARAEGHAIVRR